MARVADATILTRAPAIRLTALALSALSAACTCAPSVALLSLSPANGRLSQGETLQYVASAVMSDGSTRDVTALAAFSVDDGVVARMDTQVPGKLKALQVGTTRVRATLQGVVAQREVVVLEPPAVRLDFQPHRPLVPVGLSIPLRILAVTKDGRAHDVTAEALLEPLPADAPLSLSPPAVMKGHHPGEVVLRASWRGVSGVVTASVTSATVQALSLSPFGATVPLGSSLRLQAQVLLSDGSSFDGTEACRWETDPPSVASVSNLALERGLVTGLALGRATVSASLGPTTGSTTVEVNDAVLDRVEVSPASTVLPAGRRTQLSATALFSDGSAVDVTSLATWATDASAVATVSTWGEASALTQGEVEVTASIGGAVGKARLTVSPAALDSLLVSPPRLSLAKGTFAPLTASARFSDGTSQDVTRQVVWDTSQPLVAQVRASGADRGTVDAVTLGAATVSATLDGKTASADVTVTDAVVTALQVRPSSLTLAAGTTASLEVTGILSDGTRQRVTAQASYASADATVASVSSAPGSEGLVRGQRAGDTTLTVRLGPLSAQVPVTVTAATLQSLAIVPALLSLPRGGRQALEVSGVYSDGTTQALTTQATWSTDDAAVASVSNAPGTQGQLQALAVGSTVVRAQVGTVKASASLTVTAAVLTRLEVTPLTASVAAGRTVGFTATGVYSDATTQDLTSTASWASSDAAVAHVSAAGVATGLAVGTSTVSATVGTLSASASLAVSAATLTQLSLSPAAPSLAKGTSTRLTATGTYSDGSTRPLTAQVTWTSSDATVGAVSNVAGSEGEVRALLVGTAVLQAALGSISANTTLTVTPATLVSLGVTPALPTAPLGAQVAFVASGVYTDGTTQDVTGQATWTSSSSAVASISNSAGTQGRATALSVGSTTITATVGATTASTTLTVGAPALASISLSPATARLARGTRVRFTATGVWTDGTTQDLTSTATWSSSDTAVAQVSNSAPHGRTSALAAGSVTISATSGSVTGTASLTVTSASLSSISFTPSTPSAAAGLTLQLHATGHFDDGTTQELTDLVSWSSSDTAKATVSNSAGSEGRVQALAVGTPTLSATALGRTDTVVFTVTQALLVSLSVSPTTLSLAKGSTHDFVATGLFTDNSSADITSQVTWTSSDAAVASLSNAAGSRGRATALSTGTATLTASQGSIQATASLTVTPATLSSLALTPVSPTLPKGLTQQLTATGTYSDGTTADLTAQATWSISSSMVASASNSSGTRGLVTALGVGTATVSAQVGSVTGSTGLTVTAAQLVSVGLTPASPSIPLGLGQQLTATGLYTDASTQDITEACSWSSGATGVAGVSSVAGTKGKVTSVAQGTATISASCAGGASGNVVGSTTVTVTGAVLQSIQLTPSLPGAAAGFTLQLTATGLYSDSTTQDVTEQASWTSGTSSVATVSNTAGSKGLAKAVATGTSTLTAAVGTVSGSTTLTVTPAVLQQLQVTPASASKAKGLPQQFTATGVFSDATTQDLTSTVTWSSSDSTAVQVSNASGTQGLASTLKVGSVTVTATRGTVTGSTSFSVTAAVLTGITVTPSSLSLPLGTVRQLTVTGSYTDGTTTDLTSSASFSSSDTAVLEVSNAAGSKGLCTTVAQGSATVSLSASGYSATVTATVTQAALAYIDIIPSSGSTPLGYTRQLIALGTYTDNTTAVVTSRATWTSSDTSKALISNASTSAGLLSTVATGTVTVTATVGTVSGSTQHTVSAAVLTGLSVSPSSATVGVAGTRQLSATGSFSDGSTRSLTTSVTWTSSSASAAAVSNAAGSEGLVTGLAAGSATITATSGSWTATASITVQ